MTSKLFCASACFFVFAATQPALSQEASNLQFQTSTTPAFVSWHSTRGNGKGYQFFSTIEGITKFTAGSALSGEAGVRTGYISSNNESPLTPGTVSTLTDTTTHLQFAYEGFDSVQPFVTFDMNLPTGKATLRGRAKNAVMDRDLVFQTRFGEGWNFNPGIGVTVPFGQSLVTTLAVGYNSRGSYVPDGDTGFHYDPGDQVIVTAGVQYLSEDWLLSVTGILTRETTSKLAGVEFFRPGTSFAILGQGVHKWDPQHATTASLYFNNTEKNAVLDFFTGALLREEENSNSALTIARLSHQYDFSSRWGVFGAAELLYRDANLYDEVSDLFIPAKTKATIEGGLVLKYSPAITGNVSAGVFSLRQASTPYAGSQRYEGFISRANLSVAF
jgi:hypothetical protein